MDSTAFRHRGQVEDLEHFLLKRFSFVARILQLALHQKKLTYAGILRFQITFQMEGGGWKEEEGLDKLQQELNFLAN